MKKISKLVMVISFITIPSFIVNSVITYNTNFKTQNTKNNLNKPSILKTNKTFPATKMGGNKDNFYLIYIKPSESIFCGIDNKKGMFSNLSLFNFNNGKIEDSSVAYTIVEIADSAFSCEKRNHAFKNCNLVIPSTIKKIGKKAFYKNRGNDDIISINFEEGIEYIGESAFEGTNNLKDKTIRFPNSLKAIENRAFIDTKVETFDLSELDHVIDIDCDPLSKNGFIPNTTIKKIYFKNQEIMKMYLANPHWNTVSKYFEVKDQKYVNTMWVPGSLINPGFKKTSVKIQYINPNNCKLVDVNNNDFTISDDFDFHGGKFSYSNKNFSITEIGENLFASKKTLKNANLISPSTIKKIGKKAFYKNNGNHDIASIKFNEGLEYICESAFEGCHDIKEKYIKFPQSLLKIENRAFIDTKLEVFDLSELDHVIDIDCDPLSKNGFLPNTTIKKIYLKNQEIMKMYLANPHWNTVSKYFDIKSGEKIVEKIWLPMNLISNYDSKNKFQIEYSDPSNCKITKLDNIHFIASNNFNFNGGHFRALGKEFTITEIDNEVFKIGTGSSTKYFKNCVLTIPSTIKKVGKAAFKNNSHNAANPNEIVSINIEDGVKTIGESAFEKCRDLTNKTIKLPNSISRIGNRAFIDTRMETLDLSELDHVIDIDCDPLSKNGFLPNTTIKKIYLKDDIVKNKYLNDNYWKHAIKYFDVVNPRDEITVSASKIFGAKSGTITLDVHDPNNAIVTECSPNFCVTGNFNFNDGKFIYYGKKYTITEIDNNAFKVSNNEYCFFENCNLTIPFTINKIGKEAFANYSNSNVYNAFKSINFESGIQSIGDRAFANALNEDSNHSLILPPTIKYLGNQAFENNYLNEIVLDYVEDVIKLDSNALSEKGCFVKNEINKIYVSSQKIKERYINNDNWKCCAKYIDVKDAPTPIEKNIINITLDNQTTYKIDAKYIDGLWDETTENIILGDKIFERDSIQAIRFSNIENLISINNCFLKDCKNLETVDLSYLSNLQSIGDFFLANCPKVKNIVLPKSLVSIGNDFLKANTTIEEVELTTPNLKQVGYGFLEGCINVETVDLSADINNFLQYKYNFVGDSNKLEHIYVGQSLLDKYLQNKQWSSHFAKDIFCSK